MTSVKEQEVPKVTTYEVTYMADPDTFAPVMEPVTGEWHDLRQAIIQTIDQSDGVWNHGEVLYENGDRLYFYLDDGELVFEADDPTDVEEW